jgi:hypothetical protein
METGVPTQSASGASSYAATTGGGPPQQKLAAADHGKVVAWVARVLLLDPETATVADFIGALKSLITKASMVTTPDAEKKNLWPHALEALRALPPVDPKQFITLWGKCPLKAFEGWTGNASLAFNWPLLRRLKEGCVNTHTA